MVRWRNFIWLVLLVSGLLAGVIGCSNSDLPRVGQVSRDVTARSPNSQAPGTDSRMAAICRKFDSVLSGLPELRVSEYPLLQERIRQASPLVGQNAELMQRAHVRALEESNQQVIQLLIRVMNDPQSDLETRMSARKMGRRFTRMIHDRRILDPEHPRGEEDLRTLLGLVLEVAEGSPCANGYLSHFYAVYLRELDPFSRLTFGSSEASAQEDTRGLSVQLPDRMATEPAFEERDHNQPAVLELHSWDLRDLQGKLDAVLSRLEADAGRLPGLVLDLRYAGGTDASVLDKIRASAARSWGRLPITLWVNYATHGLADVFAYELSSKANVQVLGPDDETYGFARRLKSDSVILVDGLAPAHFMIGTEPIEPAGSQGHDGFRVRLPRANVHPEFALNDILEAGIAWDHQVGENPAAEPPTAELAPQPLAPVPGPGALEGAAPAAPAAAPAAPVVVPADPAEPGEQEGAPVQMPPQAQAVEAPVPMAVYSYGPEGAMTEAGAPPAQQVQPAADALPQPQAENVAPPPAEIPANPYSQPGIPGPDGQPPQREFTHPNAPDGGAQF